MVDLNPIQVIMSNHHEGPALFNAEAGSGKSTGIMFNLKRKQELGFDLTRVMVTTFSRDAAADLKKKIMPFYGEALKIAPIGTSHSIALRMLRDQGYARKGVVTELSSRIFLKKLLEKDSSPGDDGQILNAISYLKNQLCFPMPLENTDCHDFFNSIGANYCENSGIKLEKVQRCWIAYENFLSDRQEIDMDDMLFLSCIMLKQNPDILEYYQERYTHIIVDEYQDCNRSQYEFYRLLAAKHRNFMAVGDDDQAIYGFRGSFPIYITNFLKAYPDAVHQTLDQNYRCQAFIAHAANSLIANNNDRMEKSIKPVKASKQMPMHVTACDEREEAQLIATSIANRPHGLALKEIAVLTRTNAQQCWLEEALVNQDIPYEIVESQPFYNKREIQTTLAYLQIAHSQCKDMMAIKDVANKPYRKISKAEIANWNNFRDLSRSPFGHKYATDLMYITRLYHQNQDRLPYVVDAIYNTPVFLLNWARQQADIKVDSSAVYNMNVFMELCRDETLDTLFEKVKNIEESYKRYANVDDKVVLSTIHRSKGMEWDCVYIPGCNDEILPHKSSLDVEEERRLMYVGVTRARKQLYLLSKAVLEPSPFIEEMGRHLEFVTPQEYTALFQPQEAS